MLQRPRIPSSFCRKRVRTSPTMSRPFCRAIISTHFDPDSQRLTGNRALIAEATADPRGEQSSTGLIRDYLAALDGTVVTTCRATVHPNLDTGLACIRE